MPRVKTLDARATEKQVTAAVLDAARIFGLALERQNVGMSFNASGSAVRFGEPGDPDYRTTIPSGPSRGRGLYVEMKREGFDPRKLRGEKAKHFARQLARMKQLNEDGAMAFWVDNGPDASRVFQRLMLDSPLWVEFDANGFPYLCDDS